ncbi:uncharacterized protein PG998_014049 [Apiospora kogelbergensis]|uniref:uncharacterized protein n=1 Tax=Apiospora kogelbergensis TaxID=1337665 RepID=UPI00312DD2A5
MGLWGGRLLGGLVGGPLPESRRDSCRAGSPDRPAAAQAVFATWELLEAILSSLTMRELLLLQRVSVAFRDVIRDSTPIQQKLFLRPVATETTASGEETVPNPLLMQIFPPFFGDHTFHPRPVNPLPYKPIVESEMYTWLRAVPGRGLLGGTANSRRCKEEALNRSGASWRSMLVSQPPPRRLKYNNRARHIERLVVISRDEPVRMGAIYDLAYYSLWRTGAVRVDWQFYAQPFDERGLPLLHEKFGLETTPGAAGYLDICVVENKGCQSATAVPHPTHLAPKWNEGSLTRLEAPRCQHLRSDDYDRDAMADGVLREGAGITDAERIITINSSYLRLFLAASLTSELVRDETLQI